MKMPTVGFIGLSAALALGLAGCNRAQGPDPAAANMAPSGPTEPVAASEAPVQNSGYQTAQLNQAPAPPPPLPEYNQPPCPGENYMWTPGYWVYSNAGYYWTPGAWVSAPYAGALWTPPWWGYSGGVYIWHAGYWGPYVGFYGGIDYGFGYTGRGFYGGYWHGDVFNYNRSVMNVNTTVVRNVYDRRVTNFTPVNRISYNGGNGGVNLRPNGSEAMAMRARRMGPAPEQVQYQREAAANREQFAAVNHGRPNVAAARPVSAPAAAAPGERRAEEGQVPRKEAPAVNGRSEPRGGFEARGGAPPVNTKPQPSRDGQRIPQVRQNPAGDREAQRGGRPAVEPYRPTVSARPSMPEQRPSPFRSPAGRPQMNPAPRGQEHSADRRMPEPRTPEPRPQAPGVRQGPPQARQPQHMAAPARPAAPQGRPAPAAHQEPQRQDRDKHSK
jgi:WXXGXW repeat (2 copies)